MQLSNTIRWWIRADANLPPHSARTTSLTLQASAIWGWAQSNTLWNKNRNGSSVRKAEGHDVVTMSRPRTRQHRWDWPMDAFGRREKLRSITQQCFKQHQQGQSPSQMNLLLHICFIWSWETSGKWESKEQRSLDRCFIPSGWNLAYEEQKKLNKFFAVWHLKINLLRKEKKKRRSIIKNVKLIQYLVVLSTQRIWSVLLNSSPTQLFKHPTKNQKQIDLKTTIYQANVFSSLYICGLLPRIWAITPVFKSASRTDGLTIIPRMKYWKLLELWRQILNRWDLIFFIGENHRLKDE